jgi:hypothetical protein
MMRIPSPIVDNQQITAAPSMPNQQLLLVLLHTIADQQPEVTTQQELTQMRAIHLLRKTLDLKRGDPYRILRWNMIAQ